MTVAVDAVVYYRISNATIAITNVEDYGHSTRLLAATTLRNVLGTKNLSEILSERETISHVMQVSLAPQLASARTTTLQRKVPIASVRWRLPTSCPWATAAVLLGVPALHSLSPGGGVSSGARHAGGSESSLCPLFARRNARPIYAWRIREISLPFSPSVRVPFAAGVGIGLGCRGRRVVSGHRIRDALCIRLSRG